VPLQAPGRAEQADAGSAVMGPAEVVRPVLRGLELPDRALLVRRTEGLLPQDPGVSVRRVRVDPHVGVGLGDFVFLAPAARQDGDRAPATRQDDQTGEGESSAVDAPGEPHGIPPSRAAPGAPAGVMVTCVDAAAKCGTDGTGRDRRAHPCGAGGAREGRPGMLGGI
jgi:hypothetical protein